MQMIYELTLELFNTENTATRTIKVDSKTSFRQLHAIIQTSFNWSGFHPYIFIMQNTNYIQAIGDHRLLDHPALHFYSRWQVLDSKKQMLSTWLKENGDALTYEYYPGRDTQFGILITLESQSVYDNDDLYPIVTSAENMAIEEPHSRHYKLHRNTYDHSDITPETLFDYPGHLNSLLRANQQVIHEPIHQKRKYYAEEVENKLNQFVQREPWLYLNEESIFSVVDPETEKQLFVQVAGSDDEEDAYRITIYVGEQSYLKMRQDEFSGENVIVRSAPRQRFKPYQEISVRFTDFGVPAYLKHSMTTYQDFKEHGDHSRSQAFLYSFSDPDKSFPKKLTSQELRWLNLTLEQIFEVANLVEKGLDLTADEVKGSVILERYYSPFYQKFVNGDIYFTINEHYY